MKKIIICLISSVLFSSIAVAAENGVTLQLTQDNIDEVMTLMTVREKATLLVGTGWGSMLDASILSAEDVKVAGAAGMTRAIPRFGIPSIVLSDGPAGVRIQSQATGYPVGTLLSCTWDENAVAEIGACIGEEALEYGIDIMLAPGMNLHRNPLCGRNFEYYSEDPLLSGKIAAAMVRGIQSNGVGACLKHFAANNQETSRMENDAIVSDRALRELYLKGFEIAVKESQPWTMMSSYNKLNGEYTQQSRFLLEDILRGEWGYQGLVMTDWTMPRNTVAQVSAGNDMMQPGFASQISDIVNAVNNGHLDEHLLDVCVRRTLELIVKTPTFNGYKYSGKPDFDSHCNVARRVAAEGMVLLKNENALPLQASLNTALFGVCSYDLIAGGTGSGNVNKPYVVSLDEGLTKAGYTIDKTLEALYDEFFSKKSNRKKGNVMLGEPAWREMDVPVDIIGESASRNEFAIITIGRQAGEAKDRILDEDFNLSELELRLVKNVCEAYHAKGKKVIVVLNVGGVVETASWKDVPDAILLAWQPGQEGGNSIADVLSGVVNPSGKLSMTFPVRYLDHPSSSDFPLNRKKSLKTEYREGLNVGYRFFQFAPDKVSYPFGFGLSYSEFEYCEPKCSIDAHGNIIASVNVANIAEIPGRETVQVYVSAPSGGIYKPEIELKAFAKTELLQNDEDTTFVFTLTPEMLSSYNDLSGKWEMARGEYVVYFGSSSMDLRCSASIVY